jgi:hypothetical protein
MVMVGERASLLGHDAQTTTRANPPLW